MADPRSPAWHNKPLSLTVPAGLIAVVVTALISAAAAGGVGKATRDGDLAAVDTRIAASAEQLRRELAEARAADSRLQVARYDELLRRLDRIERQLDGSGR